MGTAVTIGLDIAKSIFQVHGVDGTGEVVIRRRLARRKVLEFFANLPACLVGVEPGRGPVAWRRPPGRQRDPRARSGRRRGMDQEHLPVPKLVARQLSGMITTGDLSAGSKLPSQRELSQRFGVSRTAIREAVSLLEASGVLRTEPGRGMFVGRGAVRSVAMANGEDVAPAYSKLDMCRFRYMLEGQTVRLAAMRRTDQQLEALDRNLHRFKAQTRAMDLHAAAATDFAFHHLIVGYAEVQLFTDLHSSHRPHLLSMIEMPRSLYNRAWEPVVEHERIVEALKRRDPDEARYYMESHIVRSAERLGIMLADDVV